ncbi:DUF1987 domain-containing protein [Fulvivirga lutea]|uniref:DUF1987 domain-containing protein n=1 Tax=Fulvivirga lutea TaxID=2810512 RepID=A0A975A165_9BACT|nr:DUF1987 domain-containing protein [Fulvivirga lutea]QSE97541.1 DUF1987 domain-containing protein [Fulvivirga lutea]
MKTLYFEATEDSPLVLLNAESNKFILKGRSFMEDPVPFQSAILEWLRNYIITAEKTLDVTIELEYVSSSSHHMLLNIMAELNKYYIFNKSINVSWAYYSNDEFMKDLVQEFRESFSIPIKELVLA